MTLAVVIPPVLRTARLEMRAPVPADLPAYRAFYAVTDLTVGSYRGGRSDAEIAGLLDRDIAHWQARGFGIFLLRLQGVDGAVLGGAGLSHPDDWPSHELTWWLLPEARGKGYASEASRAVVAWAHDVLGWPRVETHMRDENLRARRLAERLGGQLDRRDVFPDGVARDVFVIPRGGPA